MPDADVDQYVGGRRVAPGFHVPTQDHLPKPTFEERLERLEARLARLQRVLDGVLDSPVGQYAVVATAVDEVGHKVIDADEAMLVIDEIEKSRGTNNVNWMNLLRLAFRVAPEKARELFANINQQDERISALLARLCE